MESVLPAGDSAPVGMDDDPVDHLGVDGTAVQRCTHRPIALYYNIYSGKKGHAAVQLPSLDLDRHFVDFNFSELLDPSLGTIPQNLLYQRVTQARHGDRAAIHELADVIRTTLGREAFSAYERAHGPRAISHEGWFFCKLRQFLEILTFTRLHVEPSTLGPGKPTSDGPWDEAALVVGADSVGFADCELRRAFGVDDIDRLDWIGLVRALAAAEQDRGAVLREILHELTTERAPAPRKTWHKNQERDRVIQNCLGRELDARAICGELDKRTISTLESLQQAGYHTWTGAWDGGCRDPIWRLMSKQKAKAAQNSVNP